MTSTLPPPLPTSLPASGPPVALIVLMWLGWLGVLLVADFLAFMMFAFADSPRAGSAAKVMIGPVFVWFGVTFVAGIVLLAMRGWWQIPLAFVLAISPPFLVFLGYNVLAGASSAALSTATPPAPPAVNVSVPPGGFRPPEVSQTRPTDFDAIKAELRDRGEAKKP